MAATRGAALAARWREYVDRSARQSPARLAVGVLALVVLVLTVLLAMPCATAATAATASGRRAPFVDALFTAASASTVTGLVVVPTGEYRSTGGLLIR